jgi:hypothetical protein
MAGVPWAWSSNSLLFWCVKIRLDANVLKHESGPEIYCIYAIGKSNGVLSQGLKAA